jgi:hypothetical protein
MIRALGIESYGVHRNSFDKTAQEEPAWLINYCDLQIARAVGAASTLAETENDVSNCFWPPGIELP